MQIQLSAKDLRRAADIKEAIEKAEKELAALLGTPAPAGVPATPKPARRRRRRSKPARSKPGKPRAGTLAEAVRSILDKAGKPLTISALLAGLAARGRKLGAKKNARKLFTLRLYRMAGVKRVGRGIFAAAK